VLLSDLLVARCSLQHIHTVMIHCWRFWTAHPII